MNRLRRYAGLAALGTAAVAGLGASSCLPVPLSAPPGFSASQLILDDQFAGTSLNSSHWVTYLGAQGQRWDNRGQLPAPYSAENAGGSDVAMYAPSQVAVHNGLTLTAQRNSNQWAATYPWLSGVVTTQGRVTLPSSGWYVQISAQLPDTSSGMWPAIWFLPPTAGTPFNEWDGLEGGFTAGAASPNQLVHAGYFAAQGERQVFEAVRTDLSAGTHVYGFEYRPGQSIAAWIDGRLVYRMTSSPSFTISAEPYEMLLQLQVAGASGVGWHTVSGPVTPVSSLRVTEVQAYSLARRLASWRRPLAMSSTSSWGQLAT